MPRFTRVVIMFGPLLGCVVGVGSTYFSALPAQGVPKEAPNGVARTTQPETVKSSARAYRTDKNPEPSKATLPLPALQLILPSDPSCWSHARAENPQGNQDNRESIERNKRETYRKISSDPLLGAIVSLPPRKATFYQPRAPESHSVRRRLSAPARHSADVTSSND
jgi:hypothetical protein